MLNKGRRQKAPKTLIVCMQAKHVSCFNNTRIHLSPSGLVASAGVRPKAVVLFLLLHCLLLLKLFVCFDPYFVVQYLVSSLQFCNHLTEEEKAGCLL